MNKAELTVITLSCLFVIATKLRKRLKTKKSRIHSFKLMWLSDRERRIAWKVDHGPFFDFNHAEYQKLYDIEKVAEELYRDQNGGTTFEISSRDYQIEAEDEKRKKY